MDIKQLNEKLERLLESDVDDSELMHIASSIRNGQSASRDEDWYIHIEIVGKEGNDGDITSLCKALRDKTLSDIADCVEEGNLNDIIELEYKPTHISDKKSVESTAKEFPFLVEEYNGMYFWSVRFQVEIY